MVVRRRIDLFAFNDHMDSTIASLAKPQKRSRMVERTGFRAKLSIPWWSVSCPAVTTSPHRSRGWPKLRETQKSECCRTTMTARRYERISRARRRHREFPVNEETGARPPKPVISSCRRAQRRARRQPYRMDKAADMIAMGLCSILASDYYYPAPLLAAFGLRDGVLPLTGPGT